ncbi:hypothetical protein [Mycolicibacterium sp.]
MSAWSSRTIRARPFVKVTVATCISPPTRSNPCRRPNPRSRKELLMDVVGWTATAVVVLVLLAAAAVGVRSIPDIRRYLKMRQM